MICHARQHSFFSSPGTQVLLLKCLMLIRLPVIALHLATLTCCGRGAECCNLHRWWVEVSKRDLPSLHWNWSVMATWSTILAINDNSLPKPFVLGSPTRVFKTAAPSGKPTSSSGHNWPLTILRNCKVWARQLTFSSDATALFCWCQTVTPCHV